MSDTSSSKKEMSFGAWHYAVLVFFAIVFFNSSYLYNPPYWDDIIGLHNQAIFIAKHDFNPIALWNDKPVEVKGPHNPLATNSNVYPYSITPWIHAVFYKLLPPRGAHLLGHLFNMACLSIAAALAFSVIGAHQRKLTAAIIPLLALLEPIMAGRTAALGQECPLVAATMLSFYFLNKGRMPCAIAVSLLSIFIKPSAVALLLVLVAYSSFLLLLHWKKYSKLQRCSFAALGVVFVAFGCIMLKRHLILDPVHLEDLWFFMAYRSPTIILYAGISIFIATAMSLVALFRKRPLDFHEKTTAYVLCSLLFIWGIFAAMLFMPVVPPRYMAFCIFPIFALIGISLCDLKKASPFIVVMAIMFLWHPMHRLPRRFLRSGEYLERSREYLTDLETDKEICSILSEKVEHERPVVVKWPFGQMLTMPEFGYVAEPRPNTYVADNIVPKYAPVKQVVNLDMLPKNSVFLFTASSISYLRPILIPENEPEILYWDNRMPGDAFIFVRK